MRVVLTIFIVFIHQFLLAISPPAQDFLDKANLAYQAKKYNQAIFYYEKCLEKFKEDISEEDKIILYNQLFRSYKKKEKNIPAFVISELEKNSKRNTSSIPILNSQVLLGDYYKQQWEGKKATDYYLKALTNLNIELNPEINQSVLNGLGYCYLYITGDMQSALFYLLKEEKILNRINFSNKKKRNNLYNIASAYNYNQAYGKCLIYMEQCMAINEKIQPYDSLFKGKCLSVLASANTQIENIAKAKKQIIEAINITESYQKLDLLSYYYIALGKINNAASELEDAIKAFKKALQVTKNEYQLTEIYRGIGDSFLALNHTNLAKKNLDKALTLSKSTYGELSVETATILNRIAKSYEQKDSLETALLYHHQAVRAITKNKINETLFSIPKRSQIDEELNTASFLLDKVKVTQKLLQEKNNDELVHYTKAVFLLLDSLRTQSQQFIVEESVLHQQNLYHQVYENALHFFLSNEKERSVADNELLFSFFEKSRASLLNKSLYKNLTFANDSISPQTLLAEEIQVNKNLTSTTIEKNKLALLKRKQEIQIELRRKFPAFHQARQSCVSLNTFHNWLNKENVQSLSFVTAEENIYIAALNDGNTLFREIAFDANLKNDIKQFINILSTNNPYQNPQQTFEQYINSASNIYDRLLKPLISFLDFEKPLILISDGIISRIAFDALLTDRVVTKEFNYKKLPYLIHEIETSYAYSASSLLYQASKAKPVASFKVLGLSYSDDNTINNNKNSNQLELAQSANELKILKTFFGEENTVTLSGKSATKANYLKHLKNRDLLHLATHAKADEVNKNNQRLIFRNNEFLTFNEIANLEVSAQLVTLSACETGIGRYYEGEGTYSLARSFCLAGVPTVISSLWQVSDNSTSQIMQNFYSSLSDYSIAQSLRNAKIQYLKDSDSISAFPGNWGGVQIYGTIPMVELTNFNYLTLFIIICLITIGALSALMMMLNT